MEDVPSSYARNDLGRVLEREVARLAPRAVVEFGVLHAYSTIWMARGLRGGHLRGYDLWEAYPYRHATLAEARENVRRHGVADRVTLASGDFYQWLEDPEPFDLLHLDISNDGDVLLRLVDGLRDRIEGGAVVLFEGGTAERDGVDWMLRYAKRPMLPLKDVIGYEIVDERWPGLSMISRATLRRR